MTPFQWNHPFSCSDEEVTIEWTGKELTNPPIATRSYVTYWEADEYYEFEDWRDVPARLLPEALISAAVFPVCIGHS